MTLTPTSEFAALYLGNAAKEPVPVFRDQHPTTLPNAPPWPEAAVFAVYFDGARYPTMRRFWPAAVDCWEFYGRDGYPVEFPVDCSVPAESFRREFQVYPYGWRGWQPGELRRAARRELRLPGFFARMRAQAAVVRSLASNVPSPSSPSR